MPEQFSPPSKDDTFKKMPSSGVQYDRVLSAIKNELVWL